MNAYRSQLMGDVKTILLATDGSGYSEGAVQEAIFFAQACRVDLHVVHCLESNPEWLTEGHQQAEEKDRASRQHLDWLQEVAAKEGINISVGFQRCDKPEDGIIAEAERLQADVIIMGRRGVRGLKKMFMGSATAKVLERAAAKVLVVPREAVITGEKILLATDGSADSEAAEANAISMGRRCPHLKKIIVLGVASSEALAEQARANVERVRARAAEEGLAAKVEGRIEQARDYPDGVARAIVNAARAEQVDIIVTGRTGRKGLQKLLIGHVTERVVADAPCAVLVVRA
ncbi:MAG: universal stress protein [Thermodesulfobacteriota bacterium]